MEDRLNRITSLASQLNNLHELRRSAFVRSSQVLSTADEIIAKMEFLKETVRSEATGVQRRNSQRTFILEKRNNFSLNLGNASTSGTVITHAVINGENLDVCQVASSFYDKENYSKCVRLIEKVPPSETNRQLLLLCHGSYKHMLADAVDTREASKLCEWWRTYIEKVESEKACQGFRMEILECLAECLWETSRLPLFTGRSSPSRKNVMDDLMITKIQIHQLTRIDYRPFHLKFLRRIEHICFILADYFSSADENERIPRYVHTGINVVSEALSECKEDEKRYRAETGDQESDPNKIECCKLLQDMSALLNHIESEELSSRDRDDDSESTRTSGLGTPLSSPDYAAHHSNDYGDGIRYDAAQDDVNFNLITSAQHSITTQAEIHEPRLYKEFNNNDIANLGELSCDDYDDEESFVLHL